MSGGKNQKFMQDPLAFMRRYSVCVGDDIGGDIGDKAVSMPNAVDRGGYVFSTMDTAKRVAWLNFDKPKGTGINMTFGPKSEGSVIVDGTYAARPGKVKSYFLPWTAGGGIINLTIPAMGTPGYADDDVKYFFTATITGCSVFIKGTAQSPTIYHAGGQTGQADPREAARFWTDLMTTHSGGGGIAAQVNKTDYVNQHGLGTNASPATQHSQAFKAWLDAPGNISSSLEVDMVFPWGCVMGVRDDTTGDWSFYLQENVTVYYYKFSKAHWYSKEKTVKSAMTARNRPMMLRPFFPGGLQHVAYNASMPRVLK